MYSEYKVNQLLSPYIKKLWTLDNLDNPQDVTNKSVLPNGCFNIPFVQGNGMTVRNKFRTTELTEGIYFCGQATEAVDVVIKTNTKATMVQLHPWTPVHFSPLNMELFNDAIIPIKEIDQTLLTTENMSQFIDCERIERFIFQQFKKQLKQNATTHLLFNSCQRMIKTQGNVSIQELCEELGCSTRYLQKKFKTHIGISPKQFIIIIKLRNAVDDIAYPQEKDISFTELALNNNFYDQAHFNRTFQHIIKTSPRKFEALQCLLSLKEKN